MLIVLVDTGVVCHSDWLHKDDRGWDFVDMMGYYQLASVLWPTICSWATKPNCENNRIPPGVMKKIEQKNYSNQIFWKFDYERLSLEERCRLCIPLHCILNVDEGTAELWREWSIQGKDIDPLKAVHKAISSKADIFFKGPDMALPLFHDLVAHGMNAFVGLLTDACLLKKIQIDFNKLISVDSEGRTPFHLTCLHAYPSYPGDKTDPRRVKEKRHILFCLLILVKRCAPRDDAAHYSSTIQFIFKMRNSQPNKIETVESILHESFGATL